MSYLEDRPFESWFNDLADAASDSYAGDPANALGLTQTDLDALVADDRVSLSSYGLQDMPVMSPITGAFIGINFLANDVLLPAIFNAIYAKKKDRAKQEIVKEVKLGVLRASEGLANAVIHQMMAMAEQGELLARYKTLYGVVRDSDDPNARCS